MAGRNDVTIAAALEAMAQAMQNQPNTGAHDESRSLATFHRENPSTFKGKYDPDGALAWLKEIERIFRVMDCTLAQKSALCIEFWRKYYPEDVCRKKEIEFLELKQGNLSLTNYAAKFVELAKFPTHYNEALAEFSKCIKFDNGLCLVIKKEIGYQKIRNFLVLIDSCRNFEEDNNAHYRILNEKRGKNQQNRGKSYDAPSGKGK
ncbi:uncharacterized protein LOC131648742 [Vicia villosa]|uniref:uncharacterized protein LOC131648742 n=1 Tax=Vicia villosa TaxID=3911 RepID=UPI00273B9414|nr:uncharacterized protein LOC131648742 [Vicia villosa]